MTPIADLWFYAAAVPAVILVGLSKGGFGGTLAMLGVPMMALVVPPIQAAGILLPILLVMDLVALWAYRRIFDTQSLKILIPAGCAGIGLGWATAAYVNDTFIILMVGVLSLLFVADYLVRRQAAGEPAQHSRTKGTFWGLIAGFTSFVSHTGGPPFQIYTVPLRLTPAIYAGTGAMFFAVVNYLKIIPFFMLGQLDATNLATSAILLPLAPFATLAGVRLVRIVSPEFFYRMVYSIMFIIGVKLTYDGAMGFLG